MVAIRVAVYGWQLNGLLKATHSRCLRIHWSEVSLKGFGYKWSQWWGGFWKFVLFIVYFSCNVGLPIDQNKEEIRGTEDCLKYFCRWLQMPSSSHLWSYWPKQTKRCDITRYNFLWSGQPAKWPLSEWIKQTQFCEFWWIFLGTCQSGLEGLKTPSSPCANWCVVIWFCSCWYIDIMWPGLSVSDFGHDVTDLH